MPHIVVYNLAQADFETENIEKIEKAIIEVSVNVKELNLTEKDISFSFPADPTITSDKVPIIVMVELLFDKPERTFEVRKQWAQRLGQAIRSAILGWRNLVKIEVAIRRFNPVIDTFYSK